MEDVNKKNEVEVHGNALAYQLRVADLTPVGVDRDGRIVPIDAISQAKRPENRKR